jgi:hypothetical protein
VLQLDQCECEGHLDLTGMGVRPLVRLDGGTDFISRGRQEGTNSLPASQG